MSEFSRESRIGIGLYYFVADHRTLKHIIYGDRAFTAEVEEWLREHFGAPYPEESTQGDWSYRDLRLPRELREGGHDAYAFRTEDQAFEFRLRWL